MNVTLTNPINTLPVVKNSANQSRGVLREIDTNAVPSAREDSTTFRFAGSILPTGNDYSAEDAIQNQWYKENSFNIYDAANGTPVSLGNVKPSDDFIKNLEKNGIGNDVDWFKMGFDFKSLTAEELKTNVDYMASRYAVLKEHITTNFTGEEQASQLKKLEQAVGTAKETMAREFADRVGGFLEENGAAGEKEKIYTSIIEAFSNKANGYSDYIKNNADYAGISGTKNEWLSKDDAYMAASLRQAMNGTEEKAANRSAASLYSMEDLTAVGKMTQEMEEYNRYGVSISDNEETIGFKLGVLALKVDTFSKNAGISDALSAAMKKATDGFVKNNIAMAKQKLAEKERMIPSDQKGFAPLETGDVLAVYNKIMSVYEKSGDASKALKEGANFGKAQYDSKMKSGNYIDNYRYGKNGTAFWNEFHSTKKQSAYEKSTSERISDTWNSFMRQFSGGTNRSLQLEGHDFSRYA